MNLSKVFSALAHAGGAARVLCADDDPAVRDLCSIALSKAGYETHTAANGREALDMLQDNQYGAILLDLGMPSVHGATILNVLQRERPELLRNIIVVTGMSDAVVDTVRTRVAAVLRKPVSIEALLSEVSNCVTRHAKRKAVDKDITARI